MGLERPVDVDRDDAAVTVVDRDATGAARRLEPSSHEPEGRRLKILPPPL